MIARFRSARRDPDLVVIEGLHALKHAHRFGAEILEVAVCGGDAAALAAELAPDLEAVLAAGTAVDSDVFGQLAPQPPSTGVLAMARRPPVDATAVLSASGGPLVFLESPSHLGNLGACIRVAAAAGAAGLLSSGPHDPWAPEAVRGAAGLQFALPVARCDELPPCRRPLLALAPDGDELSAEAIGDDAIIAFGSERSGLSENVLRRADRRLAIPMRPGVSSLNLATAVAVTLYSRRLAG